MTAPFVSVIIPAHNEEASLAATLDSVLAQTFEDYELIVVDDASTDRTRDIVCGINATQPRVRLCKHASNRGQGEARNTGLAQARGAYVFFLDADDRLPPEGLERLCAIARQTGDDIVLGKTASEKPVDNRYVTAELRSTTLKQTPALLYNHSVWNKLYRRDFLEQNRLWFEPPRYAEDVMFATRTNLLAESISITTATTYQYTWARQVNNVSPDKIRDAQSNVAATLKLVAGENDPVLLREMQCKTAGNAFHTMVRATRALDEHELLVHLERWTPILAALPEDCYRRLPPGQSLFCRLLASGHPRMALWLWKTHAVTRQLSGRIKRLKSRLQHRIAGKTAGPVRTP